LTIQSIAADGSFTGSYVNRAPGTQCLNSPFKAVGWIDGTKISFSVHWKNATADCQSIASWTGYLLNRQIRTEFALIYLDQQGQPTFWNGKDTFH
jgi:Avidin family